MVCTNTTVFKDTDIDEIDALYAYLDDARRRRLHALAGLRLRGGARDQPERGAEIFLTRDDIRAKFKEAEATVQASTSMNTSPVYLEFLAGEREMPCTAWGNPTRNIKGWKGPCYLITDEHHASFDDLMNNTDWEKYGHGKDPRCEHCMVHSRLRGVGRPGRQQPARRQPEDADVAAVVSLPWLLVAVAASTCSSAAAARRCEPSMPRRPRRGIVIWAGTSSFSPRPASGPAPSSSTLERLRERFPSRGAVFAGFAGRWSMRCTSAMPSGRTRS